MSKVLKSAKFDPQNRVQVSAGPFALPSEQANPAASGGVPQAAALNPQQQAEAILATAHQQAEILLSQAQAQIEIWQKEAQQQGWQAGYTEAKQAAEAELADTLRHVHKLAQSAVEAHNQLLAKSQAKLGDLALAVARKIISQTLKATPEIVSDVVAEVIEAANIHGACYVRVNPEDYTILQPHWDAVAHLQQPNAPWRLIPDIRISRGGCMIDVEGGTIDAQVETKLAQIEMAFEQTSEQQAR